LLGKKPTYTLSLFTQSTLRHRGSQYRSALLSGQLPVCRNPLRSTSRQNRELSPGGSNESAAWRLRAGDRYARQQPCGSFRSHLNHARRSGYPAARSSRKHDFWGHPTI